MAYYGHPLQYPTTILADSHPFTAWYIAWQNVVAQARHCAFCGSTPKDGEIHYGKCPNCGAPMEL